MSSTVARHATKTPTSILLGDATIRFADHGQDFLTWDIKGRKVIACRPYQASLWVGCEVMSLPEVGKTIQIRQPGRPPMWIKYPLTEVRPLVEEAATPKKRTKGSQR